MLEAAVVFHQMKGANSKGADSVQLSHKAAGHFSDRISQISHRFAFLHHLSVPSVRIGSQHSISDASFHVAPAEA